MKTFFQTKVTFLESLAQLKRLEGSGKITRALRVVRERETGKLCYQAEEDFAQTELSLLKEMFRRGKNQWETCKQQCRESLRELIQ